MRREIDWELGDTPGVVVLDNQGRLPAVDGSLLTNLPFGFIDHVTWTSRNVSEENALYAVCWSPELALFVAVASDGVNRVLTSSDGVTWTPGLAAEDNTWASVCWSASLSLFVAVSWDGVNRVMTSSDGLVWATQVAAQAVVWNDVCWSPDISLFVAISVNGEVMTSANGTNWVSQTAAEPNQWYGICWAPELASFVAVAQSGTNRVMMSADGITWTPHAASSISEWSDVCWSPELDLLVATASSGIDRVMTSPDGLTWTSRTVPENNTWLSVTWAASAGLFVAVSGDGTNQSMTSPNGINWTANPTTGSAWYNICWSPSLELLVAVTGTGADRIMSGTIGVAYPPGDGSLIQNLLPATTFVHVADFGAVGNGSTDDSLAINAAIASLTDGGTVLFDEKNYAIASAIPLGTGVRLLGTGQGTVLTATADLSTACTMGQDASLEKLLIDVSGVPQSGGSVVQVGIRGTIKNVKVLGGALASIAGVYANSLDFFFEDLTIESFVDGLIISTSVRTRGTDLHIIGCTVGIYVFGTTFADIHGILIDGSAKGIRMDQATDIFLSGVTRNSSNAGVFEESVSTRARYEFFSFNDIASYTPALGSTSVYVDLSVAPVVAVTSNQVHVDDYGAVGDGSTDDLASFTAAVAEAVASGGGDIVLGPKSYALSTVLVLPSEVNLLGNGIDSSIIVCLTAAETGIQVGSGCSLSRFTLNGGNLGGVANGIYVNSSTRASIKDVKVHQFNGSGATTDGYGLYLSGSTDVFLENVDSSSNYKGIVDNGSTRCSMLGCVTRANAADGLEIVSPVLVDIANHVTSGNVTGLRLSGGTGGLVIENLVSSTNSTYGIFASGVQGATVRGQALSNTTAGLHTDGDCSNSVFDVNLIGNGVSVDNDANPQAIVNVMNSRTEFTAEEFGAVGDGIVDDTTAIQEAIAAASAGDVGGTVLLGPKTYLITGLVVSTYGVKIRGISSDSTYLKGSSATTVVALNADYSSLEHVTIDGAGVALVGVSMAESITGPYCIDVWVINSGYGFLTEGANTDAEFIDCAADSNTQSGFYIDEALGMRLLDCISQTNTVHGFYFYNCDKLHSNSLLSQKNVLDGLVLSGGVNVRIHDANLRDNDRNGLVVDSASDCVVSDVQVYNNSFGDPGVNPGIHIISGGNGNIITGVSTGATQSYGLVEDASGYVDCHYDLYANGNSLGAFLVDGSGSDSIYRNLASNILVASSLEGVSGTGTDVNGEPISLAGGKGTGTGRGGNAILRTSPAIDTGTTAQTLVDRYIVVSRGLALTDATDVTVATLTLPSGSSGGGRITATIQVTDGTDFQSMTQCIEYAIINKLGTYTGDIIPTSGAKVVSTGTLVVTWNIGAAGEIIINANTSLSPSGTNSFVVYYAIENHSQSNITLP